MHKIGIIGAGHIASKHIANIQFINKSYEIFLYDLDIKRSRKMSEKFNISYADSLEDLKKICEIFIICTPHNTHINIIKDIYDVNKYIICEKPLTHFSKDIEGVHFENVFVISQWRYSNSYHKLKTILNSNNLGDLYVVNTRMYLNRNENYYGESWRGTLDGDGGVLFNQGIHIIDFLSNLFLIESDLLEDIYVRKRIFRKWLNINTEDYIQCSFCFNNTFFNLEFLTCYEESKSITTLDIIGSKASISLTGKEFSNTKQSNSLRKNIADILNYISLKEDNSKICTFNEAVRNVKIIESLYSSVSRSSRK